MSLIVYNIIEVQFNHFREKDITDNKYLSLLIAKCWHYKYVKVPMFKSINFIISDE